MTPRITYKVTRTVGCCGESIEFRHKYQAIKWLMQHIKSMHPEMYLELDTKGRKAARSQNGRGYFDSDHEDGWCKARETFKEAWREEALAELLKKAPEGEQRLNG